MEYKPTIGLEVHAELKTKTKMFCACKNDTNEKRPNVNICPVCLGHPGALPSINREAIRHILKIGISVGGKLADDSEFDRKNYFYPDIPKGYQISQYKHPFVAGGELAGVKLTRIHLEEDTAKSSHADNYEQESGSYSLVDFNRAGVPLMELVTEPVIHSAPEVASFGESLQKLLQYLGVSEANMEKGEMRLEANISVSKDDNLGTKVEIKNLNSFRSAERAVDYEIKRQTELLGQGEKIKQETRGWNEKEQKTFPQRSKEDSHDYRYFPDPDLPKLKLNMLKEFDKDVLKSEINETPDEKKGRFRKQYGIKESDIDFYISNMRLSSLFEEAANFISGRDIQLLSNYIVSDIASLGNSVSMDGKSLANLIKMLVSGAVSSRGAKDIIAKMAKSGEDPQIIAERHGLFQRSNQDELTKIAEKIIKDNPDVVSDYKNGKTSALQFMIGQGMKMTKGSANPQTLKTVFESLLK